MGSRPVVPSPPKLHRDGRGVEERGDRWLSARDEYLFPVQIMGKLFRGTMLAALRRAEQCGELGITDPARFAATVAGVHRKDWLVYCKRPFGGGEQVISMWASTRIASALSNHRLLTMDERGVTVHTNRVTLAGVTFLARWLSHVLPSGFVKIRLYGLTSAAHATTRLELARARLQPTTKAGSVAPCAEAAPILPANGTAGLVVRSS